MKKVIILAVLALVAGQPKWHNRKAWIYGLQKEFPERRVTSILGRHSFVIKSSDSTTWYYQDIPRAIPFKENKKNKIPCHTKVLTVPKAGWVSFAPIYRGTRGTRRTTGVVSAGRPQRPSRWIVADWKEPEWDKLPAAPRVRKPEKKPKPPRKLERWELPKSWQRLMGRLPLPSIHRSLGEPMYQERRDTTSEITWYYGNVRGCGVVSFRDGVLVEWSEPFWPEVERNIYGQKANTEPSTLHYEILREHKPYQAPNSLGLDLLVGSNISKVEIITLIKTLSKDKEPVQINMYTDRKVYEDAKNNIFGETFDEHFLLFYVKNLTVKGVYYGLNEIRWMQEKGKFKDLFGKKIICNGKVEAKKARVN